MSKDLHDMDDFFKSAYQQFTDEPSATVWEKLNAGLDKKEGDANRKKMIVWRRAAIVLLLLLAGLIIFEARIFNTEAGHLKNKNNNKNSIIVQAAEKNRQNNNAEINSAQKINVSSAQTKIAETATGKNDIIRHINNEGNKNRLIKDGKQQTTIQIAELVAEPFKHSIAGINPQQSKNLLPWNIHFPIPKKMITDASIQHSLPNSILPNIPGPKKNILLPVMDNSIAKYSMVKSKSQKDKHSINPYWNITAFVSYDRVNYKLDSDLPTNIRNIKHREDHEPSFSTGILASRQITKHWGLQSGFIYSYTTIGIIPQKLYALQDPDGAIAFKYITSSGYAYIKSGVGSPPAIGDSLSITEGTHTLQYIRIPLMVKTAFGKNKISIAPGAGIEANFLTSAKVKTEIEHPSRPEIVFINKLDGAKPFHLSVVADAEIRYQVNKKLSVNLRPSFRYAITPITKNNVVETFPYSVGMGVGLTRKF